MKNNTLSIIVPCYNSKQQIAGCVSSIQASLKNLTTKFIYEIIVVDDGSTDETAYELKKINNIKVITHSKNKGLSAARNSGINASKSEYIAFIDSDISVEKKWFQKMLNLLIKYDDVMGVTGHLKKPLNNESSKNLDLYLFSQYRGIKKIDEKTPLPYKWFVFSNTIVRRSILKKVGCFDENLSSYGGEDTELAIRINKKFPTSLRKSCKSQSYHHSGKKLKQYMNNMFEYGSENFCQIIKKHPDYKKELGYNMISSFRSYFVFNPINKLICIFILKFIKHPLLIKFLVIYSFVLGFRYSKKL